MKAILTKPILANSRHPLRIQAQDFEGNKLLIPFDDGLSVEANHLITAERFAKHLHLKGVFSGAHTEKDQMMWVMQNTDSNPIACNFEVK